MKYLAPYLRALITALVTAAAYLMGVLADDATFGDVTFVQWLGAVVAVGTVFGVTQSAQAAAPPERRDVPDVHNLP
jgi:hypothetical protein